jgi:DNA-directed RNA polymerase specialized sigma24 family protein
MLEPTELPALDARPTEFDFEGFFQVEYPQLARACYLLTGDAAEAEDLAQEAMARTFERWNRVRSMDSPSGYVYRTAFNLNQKRLRRLSVRARRLIGALQSPIRPRPWRPGTKYCWLCCRCPPPSERRSCSLGGSAWTQRRRARCWGSILRP